MSSRWQPQKMAWWYYALLDEIVKNPTSTPRELAKHFNVSEVCIRLVTSSDMFKATLETRMRDNSKYLDDAIRHQAAQNALRGLQLQSRIMETKQQALPLEQLTNMVDKTLERLGYGVKGGGVTVNAPGGQTNVVVPVSLNDLEMARAALRRSELQRAIEHGPRVSSDSDLVLAGDSGERGLN